LWIKNKINQVKALIKHSNATNDENIIMPFTFKNIKYIVNCEHNRDLDIKFVLSLMIELSFCL
jgi:hypothetical protein